MTREPQGGQDFTEIAKYRILKRLGAGTYGRVYLGQHPLLDRQVAIKVFLGNIDAKKERERFLHEARLQDQLKHPHILPLYDVGIQEELLERDIAYLLIEYAPNGSLRDRLDAASPHPLPLEETLTVLSQVGDGLQYAHQHKIVHRDLKPENILFNARGEALLADFGIAIVLSSGTQWGKHIGTPAYMAPEQIQGSSSQKSDQYALGCIAYELVTGQHPFAGADHESLIYQQMHAHPVPPRRLRPALSLALEQAILRAMAKDQNDRYPDIPTFLTALHGIPLAPMLPATPPSSREVSLSQRSSSISVPPRALRELSKDRPSDLPVVRQGIVRRVSSVPQFPAAPRVQRPLPHIRVAPAPGLSVPRVQRRPLKRDWRIILTCLLGLGGTIGGSVLLTSLQDLPFLLRFFLIVGDMACVAALLMGVIQVLAVSHRTKARRWLMAVAAGPVVLGLLGLLVGSIGGLSVGLVLGLLISSLVSITYGWQHPSQASWAVGEWHFHQKRGVGKPRR